MNYNFLLILVVILVIGTVYYCFEKKRKEKEDFASIGSCNSKLNWFKSYFDNHSEFAAYLNHKNVTNNTYQNFGKSDFQKRFAKTFIYHNAMIRLAEKHKGDSAWTSLRFIFERASRSTNKVAEFTFYTFTDEILLKIRFDTQLGRAFAVDYTSGKLQKTSWPIYKNAKIYSVSFLGRWGNGTHIAEILTSGRRRTQCHSIPDLKVFLDQVKYVELNSDTQTRFKAQIYATHFVLNPLPKIQSIRVKKNRMNSLFGLWRGKVIRPSYKYGYKSLGDYIFYNHGSWNSNYGDKGALMVKEGKYTKRPNKLSQIWNNYGSKDKRNMTWFYRQEPPAGYICLGDHYHHRTPYNGKYGTALPVSRNHPHVCIHKSCLENTGSGQRVKTYGDHGSRAKQDGMAVTYYHPSASFQNKKGYPGHYLSHVARGYSFDRHGYPSRRVIIKDSCLKNPNAVDIDETKLKAEFNRTFRTLWDEYERKHKDGYQSIRQTSRNVQAASQGKKKQLAAIIRSRKEQYDSNVSHNKTMDERKRDYLRRTIFLNKLKRKLKRSEKLQKRSNIYDNNRVNQTMAYDKGRDKTNDLSKKLNDQKEEEADDAVKNIDTSIQLKLAEIKKPERASRFFT